jgi:hypothetical protein
MTIAYTCIRDMPIYRNSGKTYCSIPVRLTRKTILASITKHLFPENLVEDLKQHGGMRSTEVSTQVDCNNQDRWSHEARLFAQCIKS